MFLARPRASRTRRSAVFGCAAPGSCGRARGRAAGTSGRGRLERAYGSRRGRGATAEGVDAIAFSTTLRGNSTPLSVRCQADGRDRRAFRLDQHAGPLEDRQRFVDDPRGKLRQSTRTSVACSGGRTRGPRTAGRLNTRRPVQRSMLGRDQEPACRPGVASLAPRWQPPLLSCSQPRCRARSRPTSSYPAPASTSVRRSARKRPPFAATASPRSEPIRRFSASAVRKHESSRPLDGSSSPASTMPTSLGRGHARHDARARVDGAELGQVLHARRSEGQSGPWELDLRLVRRPRHRRRASHAFDARAVSPASRPARRLTGHECS